MQMQWKRYACLIPNKSMKKSIWNSLLLNTKRRKGNFRQFKNSRVCIFFFTSAREILYKLRNPWRCIFPVNHWTKCICICLSSKYFPRVQMFSENCFTSVLNSVNQLMTPVNRYSSLGWLDYIQSFLCISCFCPRKIIFNCFQLNQGLGIGLTIPYH